MAIIASTVKNARGEETTMYIEVEDKKRPTALRETKGIDPYAETRGVVKPLQKSFSDAMDLIQTCAEQVYNTVSELSHKTRPQDFEVQFSVKIDAEVGAILAKTQAEAQLQVTLTWKKKDDTPDE